MTVDIQNSGKENIFDVPPEIEGDGKSVPNSSADTDYVFV